MKAEVGEMDMSNKLSIPRLTFCLPDKNKHLLISQVPVHSIVVFQSRWKGREKEEKNQKEIICSLKICDHKLGRKISEFVWTNLNSL